MGGSPPSPCHPMLRSLLAPRLLVPQLRAEEEDERHSRGGHPGRLAHPFSLSGWHQAASHANVWVFSHGSREFWQGLHYASLLRSPATRPSPSPGFQALLLASCLPRRAVARMDPETEAPGGIWFGAPPRGIPREGGVRQPALLSTDHQPG